MPQKVERDQKTHDRKVRELARQYRREGYSVKADGVRGYERPCTIGVHRYRPDIEATKSGKRIVVEVKTTRSLARDREQLKTFARSAARRSGTKFHVVVTKPGTRQSTARRSTVNR